MKLLERLPFDSNLAPAESNLAPSESIRPQMSFISRPEAPMVSDMLKSLRTGVVQSRTKQADRSLSRLGKHRLDQMDPARVGKNLVMFRPTVPGRYEFKCAIPGHDMKGVIVVE